MSSRKGHNAALFEVRQASDYKGRGAFALKDIRNAGSTIMEEKEAFLAQEKMVDPPLPFLVCEHCLRFIGSVPEQLELITTDLEYESLPSSCLDAFKPIEPKLPAYRSCEDCGAAFCEKSCFDKASKLYHKRLCPRTLNPSEDATHKALTEFWDLDAEKPNLRLHFAAKMIAMVMNELDENKNQTAAQAREKLLSHWHTAPYSLVIAKQQRLADPATTDDNLVEILSKPVSDAERAESDVIFSALLARPLECLKVALSSSLSPADASDLFSRESFDSMLGIVHLNSVEVHVYSPLHQYLRDALTTGGGQAQGPLVQLANMIAERYGGVPRCEGSALFRTYAMANHSCKFNIVARGSAQDEIWNKEQFAKTSWVSTGPIAKGTELCLPYIDTRGKSRADRQRELWKKYSFFCQCRSCLCSNPKCLSLEGNGSTLRCSRCKAATYCSQDCQHSHWSSHKAHCKNKTSK